MYLFRFEKYIIIFKKGSLVNRDPKKKLPTQRLPPPEFPDMFCIEGFYSVIGSPLVVSEGGRDVVQTAAETASGVGQARARRGPGVAQVWPRCASKVRQASVRRGPGVR